MAFSFRAGTNWCHDFPKLARESGFHFNMHRRRVRVDWNRIGSIDIDRVIGERDFSTVDENVNNVVDYCLESEYDVKILDPNFVKLFRLAQLAVEYLLYCKQYLDHSVVILKEELRSKQSENSELRSELGARDKSVKELRDKLKERSRIIETKLSDSHGEIHKCPQCPKTFLSALFMNAHLNRRHPNISRVSLNSPVHEQYRAETEKLHNEIKSLKERLNLTERIVRNDTDKLFPSESIISTDNREFKPKEKSEAQNHRDRDDLIEEQHRRYQEEIGHLKTTLFEEIRNLKLADKYSREKSDDDTNLKELLREQQNEISRLRHQLTAKVNTELDRAETRRDNQDEIWQSKMENLEARYRADIEKLYRQLKSNEESADRMRIDYSARINDLERREASVESELIEARNAKNNGSKVQVGGASKGETTELVKNRSVREGRARKMLVEEENASGFESEDSSPEIRSGKSEKASRMPEDIKLERRRDKKSERVGQREMKKKEYSTREDFGEIVKNGDSKNRSSESQRRKTLHQVREYSTKNKQPEVAHRKIEIISKKPQNMKDKKMVGKAAEIDENSASISDEETESSLESETSANYSQSELEQESKEEKAKNRSIAIDRTSQKAPPPTSPFHFQKSKETGLEMFHSKLRDIGIDPEWRAIPDATFKQVFEIVRHHRNINSKKYRKFEDVRRKLINQLSRRLALREKEMRIEGSMERSQIDRLVTNVKSKVSKAFNILEKNDGSHSTHKLSRREKPEVAKFAMERSPSRKTIETKRNSQPRGSLTSENSYENEPTRTEETREKRFSNSGRKTLVNSYESIKDFIRDSNPRQPRSIFNVSGTLVASTPQKMEEIPSGDSSFKADQSPAHSALGFIKHEVASSLSLINSPRNNNKSVLKSTIGGSVGNLSKKKVLFDLQTPETVDRRPETPPTQLPTGQPGNFELTDKNTSESDFDISSIHDEREQRRNDSTFESAKVLLLKTSQSEKIAQISQQIEQQLSMARRKPAGAVEAMFLEKMSLEVEKKDSPSSIYSNVTSPSRLNFRDPKDSSFGQINLPEGQNREARYLNTHKRQDETKDSNLDFDIDELLRME